MHRLLKDGDDGELRVFLATVRAMSPAVVTVAEREVSHNSPVLLHRFMDWKRWMWCSGLWKRRCRPIKNRERVAVEQVWFGRWPEREAR